MGRLRNRCRRYSRTRKLSRGLRLERLGERAVMDGAGLGVSAPLPWFDPELLTYSFVPDGTEVAGQQSELFSRLAPLGTVEQWQSRFDAAFQQWLEPLGAAISAVADSGSPLGVTGPTQGDHRFGDVRIAAIPLSPNVVATSIPHSAMAQGTWAGDILINADYPWTDLQEIYAVALHEFGHVLGVGHSEDPSSPMFLHGVHDVTSLTADDVHALRDLYLGIEFEQHDEDVEDNEVAFIEISSSDSESETPEDGPGIDLMTAINLTPSIGSMIRYAAVDRLANFGESVLFRLDPVTMEADDLESLTIALRATGSARADAEIHVYDEAGHDVDFVTLHHGQGDIVIVADNVKNTEAHYVEVRSYDSVGSLPSYEFELIADYSSEVRQSQKIGEFHLSESNPVVDQPLRVSSSRLVHVHLDSPGRLDPSIRIDAVLVDSLDHYIARIPMSAGLSRSAPLALLAPGDYTLRIVVSSEIEGVAIEGVAVRVHIDEVSIDVGPGIGDPSSKPELVCNSPDGNPQHCYTYIPIEPLTPVSYTTIPEPRFPWWYGYGFACDDYGPVPSPEIGRADPYWWQFYVQACSILPPETTPGSQPPTSEPPSEPPTSEPPPVAPPPATPLNMNLWFNSENRFDVSGDALVTALDALLVINAIARGSLDQVNAAGAPTIYADVTDDRQITALDALLVINHMSQQTSSPQPEWIDAVFASVDEPSAEPWWVWAPVE